MSAPRWGAAWIGSLAVLALASPSVSATVPAATRVEVEAAVPSGLDAEPGLPVRERVVIQGIEEAVREVALRYSDPLAGDPLVRIPGSAQDFVLRYRVLERIGERPVSKFRGNRPRPAREYAARIEVHVDTPRLTDALAAVGLWQPVTGERGSGRYWIEAPLEWSAWSAFQRALLAAGAARAVPEEISSDGMGIRVDGGRGDPASIVARVSADPPEGLDVDGPTSGDPPRLRLRTIRPEDAGEALLD